MSQSWGVELAVLALIVAAAIIVAVLARRPHGTHARRPDRPRALMLSGLVVLAGAAFAGAWAATMALKASPPGPHLTARHLTACHGVARGSPPPPTHLPTRNRGPRCPQQ